ncbi:uncharacterized protein LOC127095336 [Lathyrus oleraceus]|uniref:uncharacterized protein LOC127095336 n=1 Tax=Pisum sativum TaxID=3888 RepID=UPI0021CF2DFC|nr:uncharacterized protein LOC127095336 [Pisum sativum]
MSEIKQESKQEQSKPDNISFHFALSVNRWKYVYQKRLALERELAQNVLDCKDIMDLIQEAGLMKTVTQFSKCYEMLVKEFIVNLSEEYADGKSKEFRKVYVRGKCVNFSPSVINKYLGRPDEAQPELEKRLDLERELAQNVQDCKDILDLTQEAGLMKTMTQFSKCYEMLVKEFIVNLSEEYADGKSKEFRKVYVRGKCVNSSPSVINKYLGRPDEAQPELEVIDNKICQVITANQVRKWPLKGKFVASKLSVKYAMLHKIGAANWVPTNHKSTVVHAGSFSVKGPIAFPSLICGIVLNQFPNIITENDSVKKRDSPMSFNHKLVLGTHDPDIVMTSGETSRVSNQPGKADIIAMLKETHKELEARKLNLEKLISSLEMTEGDVLADGGEFGEVVVAEEAERQGEEGEADASPDDGTDDDADSESDD